MNRQPAIRHARLDDIPALLAIENTSFPGNRLDRRRFRYMIGSAHAMMLVDATDTGLRGYVLILLRANSPIARLYSIATHPDHLGQGVASALVQAAERLALAHGRTRQRLEIRADNAASLALFFRHGYRAFGHHRGYYHDSMDALRLEKALGASPSSQAASTPRAAPSSPAP